MTWKDESKIVPDGPKIESCTGGLSRWSSKIESLSSHQPPPSGATVSLQACAMPAEPPPKTGQWIMSWSPLCCDVTEGFSNRSLRTTLLHLRPEAHVRRPYRAHRTEGEQNVRPAYADLWDWKTRPLTRYVETPCHFVDIFRQRPSHSWVL